MAWFKCGGGGIPAVLKSLMNSVFNKKFGTAEIYPPEKWPDTVNLMGPLEEKTVSGSVVTFSDGADDVPIKSASFGIVASGGGGTPSTPVPIVGKSSVTVYHGKKNVFDITTYPITKKRYIRESDGYFAISTRDLRGATEDYVPCVSMRGKTWVINKPNQTGNTVGLSFYDENKAFLSSVLTYPSGTNGVFTVPNNAFYFRFSVDLSSEDDTEIQIEAGTTATAFSPFFAPVSVTVSLGQTVYGGTLAEDGTLTVTHNYFEGTDLTTIVVSSQTSDVVVFSARFSDNNLPSGVNGEIISNRFDTSIPSGTAGRMVLSGNILYFVIDKNELVTIDGAGARQWFANNSTQFVYELATPIVITGLDEISLSTYLGDNSIWCDSGDLSVTYRSSGTQTLIPPTLISKTITANGTYSAEDDGADGYDTVTVNVPTGATNIETVLGSGVLIEVTGVSGTDVTRTMWTRTAAQDEKVVFHPNTTVKTNTGANDGYFKVLKNGVVVVSTYANTSTTTSFSIPDIDLEAGDVLTISCGFDNYHTSAWFDLYSTITILNSGNAPVLGLGLGNPGPVNEPEEEEPDAAPEEIQEETPEEVDQNESDE